MVERYPGTGSTDVWGISFAFSGIDRQAMSRDELDRDLTLLQACWAFFDAVCGRVSAELRKGPRGGGRDRDHIARHTLATEQHLFAPKVGVRTPDGALLAEEGLQAHRDAYLNAMRAFHAEGRMARSWPLRYLIRHTAYHTLDHAWEMEDKDLAEPAGPAPRPGTRAVPQTHRHTDVPFQAWHHGRSRTETARQVRWPRCGMGVLSQRAPGLSWSDVVQRHTGVRTRAGPADRLSAGTALGRSIGTASLARPAAYRRTPLQRWRRESAQ